MPFETQGSLRAIVDDAERLLDRASRAPEPTELLVTPERLHRRNLKRRLAEQGSPRSGYRLTEEQRIAERLLGTAGEARESIDRIDRLKHVEALLGESTDANDRLRAVFGSDLPAHADAIEAAHRRVAAMTAWAPTRLDALETTAETLPEVAAADTADIVAGVRALETRLAERVGGTHSRDALLAAAAALLEEEPSVWERAFPTVDRLSLAGVSAVDAPLLDLLVTAADVGVDVNLYLRPGTGPDIAERLAARSPEFEPNEPGAAASFHQPDVRTTEFVAETPEAEARLAAGAVAGLLRDGVSPSDVLVVARDADTYERTLSRAAGRQGVSLAVWAQLPVERTLPYRLFDASCTLLGAQAPSLSTVLAPLEFRWVPPADAGRAWPLSVDRVATFRGHLRDQGDAGRSVGAWLDTVPDEDEFQPLRTYLEWVWDQPDTPEPTALHDTFEPVVDAYREQVLPETFADDSADLGRTARLARAIVRGSRLQSSPSASSRPARAGGNTATRLRSTWWTRRTRGSGRSPTSSPLGWSTVSGRALPRASFRVRSAERSSPVTVPPLVASRCPVGGRPPVRPITSPAPSAPRPSSWSVAAIAGTAREPHRNARRCSRRSPPGDSTSRRRSRSGRAGSPTRSHPPAEVGRDD